jgi:hypothetical protein
MKMVRNGRQYDYDYKTILLKGETHNKLKKESEKRGVKMTQLIDKMLDNIRNENSI